MIRIVLMLFAVLLAGCKSKVEKITPRVGPITESVYASGMVKAAGQYQAFATVSGIVNKLYVDEGDTVKEGAPLLHITNEAQQLGSRNARLAAEMADLGLNRGKLDEAKNAVDLALSKLRLDSSLYQRQKNLWQQQVGSKVDLEQRELALQNSRNTWRAAVVRYEDLQRQLKFNAEQSRNNALISGRLEADFTLKSEIDGIVYRIYKSRGDLVSPQTPLAVLGRAGEFILEMEVDEYDILRVQPGQQVLVTMDSYRDQVFEALVSRVNPLMNERNKTFIVEAAFTRKPPVLYPNVSFESNIVITKKERALLVPRNYTQGDSLVFNEEYEPIRISPGLKDSRMVEVVSGLEEGDEIVKPK